MSKIIASGHVPGETRRGGPVPSSRMWRPAPVFAAAAVLRVVLLLWGRWQDAHSPLKYTDIDYFVFTDASRYLAKGASPYDRETYRYTPLLAWMLYPTTFSPSGLWFDFGKMLFALGDMMTGYMVYRILMTTPVDPGKRPMTADRAIKYASIWLLNPMVANISTRGSSEGLLAAMVIALMWAVLERRVVLAGALLGLSVHFKIYPFIYASSIFWYLGTASGMRDGLSIRSLISPTRLRLALSATVTFMALNLLMYELYGFPFLEHSYLYHVYRIDHRHNFSVYNTLLHLRSATGPSTRFAVESLAFLPQLSLSLVLIPIVLAKKSLSGTMLAQTLAFVTFNKVCTSQYFLWYMVFLPLYLPGSIFLTRPRVGLGAVAAWVLGQVAWLQQGYQLEFLGQSTYVPGLWYATMLFFGINCVILGLIVSNVGGMRGWRTECRTILASRKTE